MSYRLHYKMFAWLRAAEKTARD